MTRLPTPPYLAFPLRVASGGGDLADRARHVRDQIEQVLLTEPGEQVFRPGFGAGTRALVFEPNATALWEITRQRLVAALADVLHGEVDPKTLSVEVGPAGSGEQLHVAITYALATIGHVERHQFTVGPGGRRG
jgi:hypothetical protein